LGGRWNLAGWQWLFVLEGGFTVFVGFLMFKFVPERPGDVSWLSLEEKVWLLQNLAEEAELISATQRAGFWRIITNRRVLLLAYIYLANITTNLGIAFFLPLILRSMGATVREANYISAIPYIAGVAGILLFGALADKFKANRITILVTSLMVAAIGLGGAGLVSASITDATFFGSGPLALAFTSIFFIALSSLGVYGTKAPFWPLPSLFLTGSAAAIGIGLINSVGNLGGFLGPYIVGWIQSTTHTYYMALYALAAIAGSAALAALCFGYMERMPNAK
jgi:nitrate/nitrite transporter NarK